MVFFTENDMLRQENFRLRLENQHLISNIARASKEIAHLKKLSKIFETGESRLKGKTKGC